MGLNIMWIVGVLLLVISPMLIGMLFGAVLSSLPIWLLYITGYIILFIIDYFIVTGVIRLAGPLALGIAVILPFIQGGLALALIG